MAESVSAHRTCPACQAEVAYSRPLCPRCHRFVPGGEPGIRESPIGRQILLWVWWVFWPASMLLGTPREAQDEISWGRVLRATILAVVIGGIFALAVILFTRKV